MVDSCLVYVLNFQFSISFRWKVWKKEEKSSLARKLAWKLLKAKWWSRLLFILHACVFIDERVQDATHRTTALLLKREKKMQKEKRKIFTNFNTILIPNESNIAFNCFLWCFTTVKMLKFIHVHVHVHVYFQVFGFQWFGQFYLYQRSTNRVFRMFNCSNHRRFVSVFVF